MKVCYKAGAVTAQNHYYSIAADAVEIRVWFLTDDIIRIRAGFDGDWDEASYSLVTTAWESRTDELMKDYRKRINVAEAALVDGETRAVITGKKLRVEVEKIHSASVSMMQKEPCFMRIFRSLRTVRILTGAAFIPARSRMTIIFTDLVKKAARSIKQKNI